jgi:uncharacterized protein (DUF736 family)
MQKHEIVHHFFVSECGDRIRLCITNTYPGSKASRFWIHVERLDSNEAWREVENTRRGYLWTYEDAEKLAKGMYRSLAEQGPSMLESSDVSKILA